MQTLNIKGKEFQNVLYLPSVFYNPHYFKCELSSAHYLVETTEQYSTYTRKPFFGDRITISFCDILPSEYSLLDRVDRILQGDVMIANPNNYLTSLDMFTGSKPKIKELLALLKSSETRLVEVKDIYMFGMFSHNMKRYSEGKHYS
jgi:hypothetical protein